MKKNKEEREKCDNKEGRNWSNKFDTSLFNKSDMNQGCIKLRVKRLFNKHITEWTSNKFIGHDPIHIQVTESHMLNKFNVKSNMDRTQLGGCCNVKEARGSLLKTHPSIQTPRHLESIYNTRITHRKQKRSEHQIFIEQTDKRGKLKRLKKEKPMMRRRCSIVAPNLHTLQEYDLYLFGSTIFDRKSREKEKYKTAYSSKKKKK